MDNCMSHAKGLSLQFFIESINYENYVVKCIVSKALKYITLEEPWSNIKLDVIHFCVFGCEAWDHIPDEKWKELQPKS